MNEQTNGHVRLEVDRLELTRNDRVIFTDLNFSLATGQILQVEGHNGSGKTSLLRILCGLTMPNDGEVRWCGEDIREASTDYYADLCYVGHYPGVKEELTPLENLAMVKSLGRAREGVDAEEVLERIGLPFGHEDQLCSRLSAGQRRRIALARLLITDARLWVVDEPFTALDRAGRRMVEEMLMAHAKAGGMVILTTHHGVELGDCSVEMLHLGT
jgi:heme exporter protein A